MKTTTVLFDIGGVLSHDGHETYLSHEEFGLARSLELPNEELFQNVNPIFRKYAVLKNASEADFWEEIGKTLGIDLKVGDIETVKQKVTTTNPETAASFQSLQDHGIEMGIISNSSPFFYPMQAKSLPFDGYVEPNLLFLSHEKGRLKSNGLFGLAATTVNPASTFVIDDRPGNVEYARKMGFSAALYSMQSGDSLLELTNKIIAENSKTESR